MSAIQLVFSLFNKGDEIIVSRDIYGGSYRLFEIFSKRYGHTCELWDEHEDLMDLIGGNTEAIFIETPTNSFMKEVDIKRVSQIARENDLICIVDNTLYTPYIQRPIEDGADIVIYSATKYVGGHNDVLVGVVAAREEQLSVELTYLHH